MRWAFSMVIAALLVNPTSLHRRIALQTSDSSLQHFSSAAVRQTRVKKDKSVPSEPIVCPSSLPALTAWMLQDLPSYANRIRQRSLASMQRQSDRDLIIGNIILAGQPEFEPLPARVLGGTAAKFSPELRQVFFTTLERDYPGRFEKPILSHSYHWLFLAQDKQGWDFVQMITRIGKTVSAQTALPPRDASNGAIAQGIRQWLRDCQAGSLHSQPPSTTKAPSATATPLPTVPQKSEAP